MLTATAWPRLLGLAALGGSIGSLLRFSIALAGPMLAPGYFPWTAVLVNLLGSALIGVLVALGQPEGRFPLGPGGQAFWMAGLCGGFTTFSFFSLELLLLLASERWLAASCYLLIAISSWPLAAWAGFRFAAGFRGSA